MPTPAIRVARPDDLDALVDLENRCFRGDRMSRRSYAAALHNPRAILLVSGALNQLQAAAAVFFRADSQTARLYTIAVSPQARGHGIGAAMLAACETAARKRGATALRLEVSVRNKSALALYRKSGYGIRGRIDRYYEDGSDALRLERPLS